MIIAVELQTFVCSYEFVVNCCSNIVDSFFGGNNCGHSSVSMVCTCLWLYYIHILFPYKTIKHTDGKYSSTLGHSVENIANFPL